MLRICLALCFAFLPVLTWAGVQGRIVVIDADTWDVGGQRVRLFGIDAPELGQTCTDGQGRLWHCGDWATEQTRARYQGRTATCEPLDRDRYNRIVARCSVDGRDVGRELVRRGLALAYRRYALDYDLDEKAAHVSGVGIHAGVIQAPSEFRAMPVQPAEGGCLIKGNISAKGERIYHLPGQEHYGRTRIATGKGERWFCSEREARAAGWRRARR